MKGVRSIRRGESTKAGSALGRAAPKSPAQPGRGPGHPGGHASSQGTRERLMEAAGEVFARRGYHDATIREICRLAGANVAAVKYHFGDKDRLYLTVLQETHEASLRHYPPDLGVTNTDPASARLGAFVRSLLLRLLDEGRPAWHAKLMAREMSDPSPALDALVEQTARPMWVRLTGLCRELLGGETTQREVERCAASVVGQCLHYKHCAAVMKKLAPTLTGDVESLAAHVIRFSLAGIQGSKNGVGRGGSAC